MASRTADVPECPAVLAGQAHVAPPGRCKPSGFTLIELLVVISVITVLIAVLLPGLGSAREAARKTRCAANLAGIGKAMVIYAAENLCFPTVTPPKSLATVGKWTNPPYAGSTDDGGIEPVTDVYSNLRLSGQPLGNPWMLVLIHSVTQTKQFVCPSDPMVTGPAMTRVPSDVGPPGTFLNFGSGTYSYGFAYPWSSPAPTLPRWWKVGGDTRIPLGADIGPSMSPATNDDPRAPVGSTMSNSKNHAAKGQNILFCDARVQFSRLNTEGPTSDNIYTFNGGNGYVASGGTKFNNVTNLNADPNDVILAPARP